MKKIIDWFLKKIKERKRKKEMKKKIEELKKRDPFIYNH
jgi:preprotein translocase subunit YajC